jgi:DNA invertase Pin-like site-specific DNA recombinase
MLIGYARGLPHDQTLKLQKDALEKAGCSKIYTDTITNAKANHPGLEKTLSVLRPGDTFVVWKLDRLGTSIKELLNNGKWGKQVYKTFAALRNVLKAKTTAGLHVARVKGRKGGRPKRLTASEIQELRELYSNQNIPIMVIRRKFHLARSTFYRYVKPTDKKQPGLKGLVHRLREIGK